MPDTNVLSAIPPARARQRCGRSARVARRATDAAKMTANFVRKIPAYEPFGDEDLAALEAHADWILQEIGIEFQDDEEALALFAEAGASVDGNRVRFDPGHARTLCATAPETFRMESRDPAASITLGGDNVVFMPAYGPPFVTDLDGGRRYATIEDFRNFVKLGYASPWLNHSGGTVCEPVDVPVNKRHLDMVYAHLRYSTKPFMGSVTAPERAEDSIAMARLVFGDAFLEDHCVIQGNINVNSPLVYDHIMSGALEAPMPAPTKAPSWSRRSFWAAPWGRSPSPPCSPRPMPKLWSGIALSSTRAPGRAGRLR